MPRKKPNILWLMTDEQRTDSLGCYGSSWARSANLDRLAEEGTLFHSAVTPSPVCVPARASILTGGYPHQIGVWWNDSRHNRTLDHLTYEFAKAGYRTATFGKQHYRSPNRAFETELHCVLTEAVRYFRYADRYDPENYDVVQYPTEEHPWIFGGRFPESPDRTSEANVVREVIEWLDQHAEDQPFLLRASFNGPHTPVLASAPFDRLIDPDEIVFSPETDRPAQRESSWIADSLKPVADSSRLTPEQIRKMRWYYYSEVSFLDHQFGVLLDWMRNRGLLENTIVVFVSDHGTHLGDYGLVQKQTFYEPVVCVPFFFWSPGTIASGVKIDTPVETRALLPTLLELTALPLPDNCRRDSLAETLRTGREPEAKPVFSELTLGSFQIRPNDRLVMVREGNWKLSLCMDPVPHDGALYNLTEDPYERTNLFHDKEYGKIQHELTRRIQDHMKE